MWSTQVEEKKERTGKLNQDTQAEKIPYEKPQLEQLGSVGDMTQTSYDLEW